MTDTDTEADPLIAALETQQAKLRAQQRRDQPTKYLTIESARWRRYKERGRAEFLFAYTSDQVKFTFPDGEKAGYASFIYVLKGRRTYEINYESVKIHKTRREAIDRAYDLFMGVRLAENGPTDMKKTGWGRRR